MRRRHKANVVAETVLKPGAVRAQLPLEEVMAYQEGQHLSDKDMLLYERVRAEMVRPYPGCFQSV